MKESFIKLNVHYDNNDVSTGKSSVLEGHKNLPFPRGSGLCTQLRRILSFKDLNNRRLRSLSFQPQIILQIRWIDSGTGTKTPSNLWKG